jgi:hypothetical protein
LQAVWAKRMSRGRSARSTPAGQRARYSLTEPAIQLVPVFAQLGSLGFRRRPTSRALRVRAELLEQGGPALWQEFMDEGHRACSARQHAQITTASPASSTRSTRSPARCGNNMNSSSSPCPETSRTRPEAMTAPAGGMAD